MQDMASIWAANRKLTVKELTTLGLKLRTHARTTKIYSAIGNGTSIVFGLGAVYFGMMAPFNFGPSLIAAGLCSGIAFAGSFTSVGSSVTLHFIEKGYLKDVQAALDKDRQSLENLLNSIEKTEKISKTEGKKRKVLTAGETIPDVTEVGLKVRTKTAETFEKPGNKPIRLARTTQLAHAAGKAVTLITLPADMAFYFKDLIDLAKGDVSFAADKILELANKLNAECSDIILATDE